jgi:hypothetical protein
MRRLPPVFVFRILIANRHHEGHASRQRRPCTKSFTWQPRSMSTVCLTVELPVSAETALGLARKPQMKRIALSRRCRRECVQVQDDGHRFGAMSYRCGKGSNVWRRHCRFVCRCGATRPGLPRKLLRTRRDTLQSIAFAAASTANLVGGGGERRTLLLVARYANPCNLNCEAESPRSQTDPGRSQGNWWLAAGMTSHSVSRCRPVGPP